MSMWDYDEQGDPYPADERRQYRDPHVSHDGSGSSQYHGGYGGRQSHGDHSHHQHRHEQHQHQHHMEPDESHSYHGYRSAGLHNSGSPHDLYGDGGRHQNHGQQPTAAHHQSYASNMASAAPYHPGYDMTAGYEVRQEHHGHDHDHGASNSTDLFTSDSVVNLTLDEIDALARTHRSRSWLVVLYAPWCRFCQAMEPNFERVANHLERSNVYVSSVHYSCG